MAFVGINPLFLKLGFAVAWLVGSWLFGPKQKKNEIFDPGAEEMPRWNTALRGITIPVLFGTNRVSSQVIWEHDYTVVRDDGSKGGGGKMGGSGGGKGGAAGNEGITYDYYWDFIFHIGMTHQVIGLSKVWLGSERIAADGVAAITGGTGGTIIAGTDDEDTDEDERTKLKFEDSIFYSGSGAALGVIDNDDAYDAWSEITSDMGLGVRWPHTVYVGFKQLHLGQYPGVPQLSFEVGSGGGEITYNTSVLHDRDNADDQRGAIGSTFMFRGDDDKRYAITSPVLLPTTNGSNLYKENPAGTWTLAATYTNADLRTLFENYGAILPAGSFTYTTIAVLDPFDKLAITAYWTPGSSANVYIAIAKINSSGVLEILGIHRQTPSGLVLAPAYQHAVFIANNRTESDPIVWVYEGAFGASKPVVMAVFPSITTITGQYTEETAAISDFNVNSLASLFPGSDYFPTHSSYRFFSQFWWGLPKATVGGLGVTYSTLLFFYIGKSDMQAHINNFGTSQSAFVDSLTGTYPNGVVGYVDFGAIAYNLVSEQVIPSSITYNNAMGAGPFDDLALYDDDLTTHANAYGDYDPHPFVHKMAGANAGSYLVIFAQNLEDNTVDQLTVHQSWMRGRVLVWNPLALTFSSYADVEFVPYLRTTDLGATISTAIRPLSTMIAWDEESNDLYYFACVNGAVTTRDDVLGKIGTLELAAGGDMTPPEIIYQILTSTIYGIGITAAMVDQTSYAAAITYCEEQEFKISCQIRREEPVLNVIDDILSCYGGFLVIANGIIYFKQLEYLDGAGTSVRTIDNDHLIADERGKPPVQITKGARQDTFNKVKVNYFDRSLEYAQNQVEEGDEVDQDLNGMRSREFPALFVMKEKMARTMAIRALWANLYSRDTYSFKLGWKDHDLAPGDCITLVDSYHNALQGGVTARIIEWKEQDRGQFQVTAKQEFEYIQAASATALNITSASVTNRLGGIPIIRDFTMYELPTEYQMSNVGMAYVSWATHKFARGANLWMSTDGTTYAKVQNQEPYQISGNLLGGLPAAYDGEFNENVEMLLSPRTAWNVSSPSYYFNQTLPSVDQAGRAVGASLLWCGSEMMAYQGVTLVAQNRYRFAKLFRGWGGTNIHAHSSGDVLYKHGGGVFYQEFNEDKIGTKVSYKVQPYNLAGHYQDISSISAKSYTIVGRHYTPQIPPALNIIWPDDQRGKTTHFVNSAIDIPVSWNRSAQKSGYGSKGHGAGGYGDFTADSQAFRVQVYGSGGLVVRSTSVASTYFSYTAAMNASDNGAWRGNVAFKVTPYNQFGDALKTSVLSLELW